MRKGGGISIWFFVGVSLLVNGVLILGAGVWEVFNPPANPVVLFQLHANLWWGAVLTILGILYSLKFSPSRASS
jgi:hypothetical protein